MSLLTQLTAFVSICVSQPWSGSVWYFIPILLSFVISRLSALKWTSVPSARLPVPLLSSEVSASPVNKNSGTSNWLKQPEQKRLLRSAWNPGWNLGFTHCRACRAVNVPPHSDLIFDHNFQDCYEHRKYSAPTVSTGNKGLVSLASPSVTNKSQTPFRRGQKLKGLTLQMLRYLSTQEMFILGSSWQRNKQKRPPAWREVSEWVENLSWRLLKDIL